MYQELPDGRAGGKTRGCKGPISIEARNAEGRYLIEPVDNATPERLFDRAWAMTLLDRVLRPWPLGTRKLAGPLFDQLKVVLTKARAPFGPRWWPSG